MVIAFGANILSGLQILFVKHCLTGWAFYPEALRDALISRSTTDPGREYLLDPTHAVILSFEILECVVIQSLNQCLMHSREPLCGRIHSQLRVILGLH